MPNLSLTKTIIANQVAKACTQELYGLHKKNTIMDIIYEKRNN